MKAKVIKTGEVVEVQLRANGSWASSNMSNTKFFDESELDFEFQEWDAFRMEAAKDAMSGMMANADFWRHIWSENRVDERCDYPSEIAHFAIACADELIRQLRDGKE